MSERVFPKDWKPSGVVMRERVDAGRAFHLFDIKAPNMTDESDKESYHALFDELNGLYGWANVVRSQHRAILGEMHEGENREIVDTTQSGIYVKANENYVGRVPHLSEAASRLIIEREVETEQSLVVHAETVAA
jgi:hypothetical protein